jgi:FAD/FMN-containing dehydrogenase
MTSLTTTKHDLEELRRRVSAPVIGADELGWDGARQAWNLAVDQQPVAVAYAASVEDVIAVVEFARAAGLGVAAQGTGHGAGTLGSLEDVILLRTVRMAAVEIDPIARVARVQAGALWGEVAGSAGEHGLAALAGSSPTVGVMGFTLGGGLGWLSRRHGLACNSVRAVELVTADGEHRRVSAVREPELFWALRGGGGGLGVVTALEIALYPVGEVFAGALVWPADHASTVLDRYREWARAVPESFSSIFRLLNAPPLPSVPEPLRGRSLVTVDAAYLGGDKDGARLLRPLRECGGVLLDTFETMPASALTRLHGDPEQPLAGIGEGFLIAELTAEAGAAFLAAGGPGSDSPLVSLELRHLGGALARSSAEHGALAALDGEYALYGVGSPLDTDAAKAIHVRLDAVARAMAPWRSPYDYLNFADRQPDPSSSFPARATRRLRQVKAAYDPDNLIRSNHPIPPYDRLIP